MNFDRMQYLSNRVAEATGRLQVLQTAIFGPKDNDPRATPTAIGIEQVIAELERNLDELHQAINPLEGALLSAPALAVTLR